MLRLFMLSECKTKRRWIWFSFIRIHFNINCSRMMVFLKSIIVIHRLNHNDIPRPLHTFTRIKCIEVSKSLHSVIFISFNTAVSNKLSPSNRWDWNVIFWSKARAHDQVKNDCTGHCQNDVKQIFST